MKHLFYSEPQYSQGVKINMMQDRKKSWRTIPAALFLIGDKVSMWESWEISTEGPLCRQIIKGIHCVHTSPAYQESYNFLNVSWKAWFELFQIILSPFLWEEKHWHILYAILTYSLSSVHCLAYYELCVFRLISEFLNDRMDR